MTKPAANLSSLRHNARRYAVQAIYQWQMTATDMTEITAQFLDSYFPTYPVLPTDMGYFKQLINGVFCYHVKIDEHISEFLQRQMHDIDYVELAIMRLASYELLYQPLIPHPIIIDEALKLTKEFGSSEGYRFVNSLLDRIAKKCRA